MSTAADRPAAASGAIREVEAQRGARNSLGLGTATALIVGSIFGVGRGCRLSPDGIPPWP
jgi:hypothetical protein